MVNHPHAKNTSTINGENVSECIIAPQTQVFNNIFRNWRESSNAGFLSKSKWSDRGRKIRSDAVPSYVVLETGTSIGLIASYVVLADYGNDRWQIATNKFEVWPESDTYAAALADTVPPISAVMADTAEIPPVTSALTEFTSSSVQREGEGVCHYDGKPVATDRKIKTCVNRRLFQHIGVRLYVPEDLTIPATLAKHQEEIHAFCDMLYRKRIMYHRHKDEYSRLMKTILKQRYNSIGVWLPACLDWLIERDGYYTPGLKSYAYRLAEPYRSQTFRLKALDGGVIAKKLEAEHRIQIKRKVHKHLYDMLARLTIMFAEYHAKFHGFLNYDLYAPIVQAIADQQWGFRGGDDFGNRVHSSITRLPRPLRALLRFDGERIGEIDICNSQPFFLGMDLAKRKPPVAMGDYLKHVVDGTLYDAIATEIGEPRDMAKEQLITSLCAKRRYTNPAKRAFARRWPEMAAFCHEAKASDSKRIAQIMQQSESKFVIHVVCERLRKKYPDMPIATIHDSLLCTISDMPIVEATILDCAVAHIGRKPKLKTVAYTEQWETDFHARVASRRLEVFGGYSDGPNDEQITEDAEDCVDSQL